MFGLIRDFIASGCVFPLVLHRARGFHIVTGILISEFRHRHNVLRSADTVFSLFGFVSLSEAFLFSFEQSIARINGKALLCVRVRCMSFFSFNFAVMRLNVRILFETLFLWRRLSYWKHPSCTYWIPILDTLTQWQEMSG